MRGFWVSARFDTTADKIRRNFTTSVSQMRCPHHQKNARVEVEAEKFDIVHIEVFTCCEKFGERVRESLWRGR
jgi:hypothetical protein